MLGHHFLYLEDTLAGFFSPTLAVIRRPEAETQEKKERMFFRQEREETP